MKGIIQKIALLCVVCLFAPEVNAQTIFDAFKKKEVIANSAFEDFSYKKAAEMYESDLAKSDDRNLIPKIAECYRKMNEPAKVSEWLSKVIHDESIVGAEQILHYAQALSSQGNYEQAKRWYEKYDELTDEKRSDYALQGLDNLDTYYQNKGAFTIEEINHNSEGKDFSPTYYQDGIVFVSNREKAPSEKTAFNWDETSFLDLYFATEDGSGTLKKPEKFHKNINDFLHEGPVAFWEDGNKMLFTRNNYFKGKAQTSSDNINKLKMFEATKKGNKWGNVTPLPFNDDEYSVGHPTVSADGSKMYFISDMPGGYGGTDLYVCYNNGGSWGNIENMGPLVNTEGNEMFPHISEDTYLFFSSNGRDGLGGLDIYRADILDGSSIANITNIGSPFNSPTDDFGLVMKNDASEGYFTSNRHGGKGDDDIYHFAGGGFDYLDEIQEEVIVETVEEVITETPDPVLTRIEEPVYTEPTYTEPTYSEPVYSDPYRDPAPSNEPVIISRSPRAAIADGVRVTFIENVSGSNQVFLSTGNEIYEYKSRGDKRYLFNPNNTIVLQNGEGLSNQIDGYQLDQELRTQKYVQSSEIIDYLNNEGIRIAGIVNIENIFYDFDQDYIRGDASIELEKIKTLMQENPELYLDLASHTDSRGSHQYNVNLSKRRAMRAMEYLISNGIRQDRIITSHFSEEVLVNDCADGINCGENKHQLNRRTEFRINF